ncbi:Cilia- and flagella-associated protein 58, partial [Acipenser ruthenus]
CSQEKAQKTDIEENAFETLERDFQEVLHKLMGDKSLEKFWVEYEKLHKALKQKKTHEIEKAWKMVDAAHEKEQRAKETIHALKQEIANLTKLVEQGAGLSMGQEHRRSTVQFVCLFLSAAPAGHPELESKKKQAETDKKAIEELVRERDILNKNMMKAAGATQKQLNLVKLHEQTKKNLDQDIQNYKEEAQKQRKIIYQLENGAESGPLFCFGFCPDEITEMKRKLKIMNHQIDQMKEEISWKEALKVHMEHQCVEKEKEALKATCIFFLYAELQKMKQQAQETKQFIDNQEVEERKLLKIIADADTERLRQKKGLDQVISEWDILGTKLVRRNDELPLLYERIKIQQSMLNKGEIEYNQRVEDFHLL